jgi:hypothetical protein
MFKLELLNFVEHAGIEDYDMMTKVTITVAYNCILLWMVQEKFKDTKGAIRSHKSKKDRQTIRLSK